MTNDGKNIYFPPDACFWAVVDGVAVSRQNKTSKKARWRKKVTEVLRSRWIDFCKEQQGYIYVLPKGYRVNILMVRFEHSSLWETGKVPDVDNSLDKSTLDAFPDAGILHHDAPNIVAGRNARALALDKPFILSGSNAPQDAISTVAHKIAEQKPFVYLKMTRASDIQTF